MNARSSVLLGSAMAVLSLCAQQNSYDSRIDSYVGLRHPCDGSVQPVLRIQNVGGETMTSCDIDVLKNGVSNSTFNWVLGSPAATNEFRQPALTTVLGVQPGDVLEFRILTVNGQPDEGITENILQVPMTDEKGDADSYQVQVKVLADDNPGETSWKVKNALGQTVAQSPVYTEPDVLRETAVTLSADQCYNFEVYDSGNDGFGEARELGYAKLVSLGAEVATVSGDFGALYRKVAQTGTGNGCVASQLTTTVDPLLSCGATGLHLNGTNTLYATEVPGANRYRFRFTNVPGQPAYARNIVVPSRSLLLTTWYTLPLKRGRTYTVQVQASFDSGSNWCPYAGSCTVSISYSFNGVLARSAWAENEMFDEAVVFPNPSEDGRFQIVLDGMDEEVPVSLEVFDPAGKRIASSVLHSVGDGAPVPVDIAPLPSGLYLLRLSIGDDVRSERFVVR